MKVGLCIGRPIFMLTLNTRNGGGEWADLYDKEVPFDVAGCQNYIC